MNKIEVGNIVRINDVDDDSCTLTHGKIGVVCEISSGRTELQVIVDDEEWYYLKHQLEFVAESLEKYLEQLSNKSKTKIPQFVVDWIEI